MISSGFRLPLGAALALACWGADCRTPLGIPCYTVRFSQSQWRFLEGGSPAFSHFTASSVKAVRRDGSFVNVTEKPQLSRWFKTEPAGGGSVSMYLAAEDQVVRIDHEARTISRRPPTLWEDRPYRYSTPGDRTCMSGIRHWGTHYFLRGSGTVASVAVIKWTGANPGGGYTEVSLAPSLDCLPLRIRIVHRKLGVFPTFISTTEAVSVELGEPKPELFALPSGYRNVKE